MHELKKTALFAAVAFGLLATAVWATRTDSAANRPLLDQGAKFFPEFKLPEQARTLEVVEVDPSAGTVAPFKVELQGGRWTIPSHDNYPADAKDRLARTAAGILDLTRDTLRSERAEDHKALGVLDPLDPKLASAEGVGTRVTLKDSAGAVLSDLILGKPVPGAEGQRFVRVPDQAVVYGVNLEGVELSTRFSDWIETDLLELNPSQVRRIVIENSKFDARTGPVPGERLLLTRADASGPFTLDGPLGDDEELNRQAVDDLLNTLDNLRIVGVRPKPASLASVLRGETRGLDATEMARATNSLATKGFYVINQQFVSAEGDVYLTLDDGVTLILQFGRIIFARGEALTAGAGEDEQVTADGSTPAAERSSGGIEGRYVFVDARFTPDRVPRPEAPRPWADGEIPDDPFARTPAERIARERADQEAATRAQAEYERKLESGREHADELAARFSDWYYVVPGESYRKLLVGRSAVVRPRGSTPNPAAPPFGAPGGLPQFPGGIPGLDLDP